MTRLTTEEFIKKAINVHGNKYDYSKSEYVLTGVKLTVGCKNHGDFQTSPGNHLKGKGCPQCAGNVALTKETFIERSKKIHKDLFDYSLVDYKGRNVKVKLICNKCGEQIEQSPRSNLGGNGCLSCDNKMKTNHDWFCDFNKKHKTFYDYSLINEPIKSHIKIKIICPIHGLFEQFPQKHKHSGCPICGLVSRNLKNERRKYENKPTYLYYVKINNQYFKVGLTRTSINERFKNEDIHIDVINTWFFENGLDALKIEQTILSNTIDYCVSKDISPIHSGWTEIRNCDIIDEIYIQLKKEE